MKQDHIIMGAFGGMLFLCFLMLAVPEKRICEVSYTKQGTNVTVVHVGVVTKF
jgi:hypothetical protein